MIYKNVFCNIIVIIVTITAIITNIHIISYIFDLNIHLYYKNKYKLTILIIK